jgi:hypothetical protein
MNSAKKNGTAIILLLLLLMCPKMNLFKKNCKPLENRTELKAKKIGNFVPTNFILFSC